VAKIVLCSKDGYGAWFVLRLLEEGHSVNYYLKDQKKDCVLGGLVPEPMDKVPDFAKYDLAIFDVTGMPRVAEEAATRCPTIGAVSYTHLDVYKRQLVELVLFSLETTILLLILPACLDN